MNTYIITFTTWNNELMSYSIKAETSDIALVHALTEMPVRSSKNITISLFHGEIE